MSLWIKLGLPIGLGLVASFMNMVATTSKLAKYVAVRINQEVEFGVPLREEMLERAEISGDLFNLPKSFVAWKDRASIYGHPAPRRFETGDLVMWRDAEPQNNILPTNAGELPMSVSLGGVTVVPEFISVGEQVSFFVGKQPSRGTRDPADWDSRDHLAPAARSIAHQIGPFRVLAVGNRTTKLGQGQTRNERILTIAARIAAGGVLDEKSDRLLAALKGFDEMEVMGVILHKTSGPMNRVRPVVRTTGS